MRAYERLLQYCAFNTQSRDDREGTPSTKGQLDFARSLCAELTHLGLQQVYMDDNAYVYGHLPPSQGMENKPTVGLIAHLDTSEDCSGENVRPQIIENYDGGSVKLGDSGLVLDPKYYPELDSCRGMTLITTDGTTLLGADDKAGIAEIMTACEEVINGDKPHCAVSVCFTPDEEIGHEAQLLDLVRLGADFAFTFDGDAVNEINYETFNAAKAEFEIKGVNTHPGTAKGIMKNAGLIASRINSLLPDREIPAETEGYEGFFHLTEICGTVEKAGLKYIIRDHDPEKFQARCRLLRTIEKQMQEEYGAETVKLTITEQYRNMAEVLRCRPEALRRAEKAIKKAGLQPVCIPVRGGTDGAGLSFRGLPCPNLGTGGAGFHSLYEHITAENMDKAVEIGVNLLTVE